MDRPYRVHYLASNAHTAICGVSRQRPATSKLNEVTCPYCWDFIRQKENESAKTERSQRSNDNTNKGESKVKHYTKAELKARAEKEANALTPPVSPELLDEVVATNAAKQEAFDKARGEANGIKDKSADVKTLEAEIIERDEVGRVPQSTRTFEERTKLVARLAKHESVDASLPNAPIMTLSGKSPKRATKAPPTDISLAEMLGILEKAFGKNNARSREVALANPDRLREVIKTYPEGTSTYYTWATKLLAELNVKNVHNVFEKIARDEPAIAELVLTGKASQRKVVTSAPAVTKSKKAAPKKQSSTKSHDTKNMYALIDSGVCPHDNAKLEKEQASGKDGATAKCSKCAHVFYINRKIHTRACRTCQSEARKAK